MAYFLNINVVIYIHLLYCDIHYQATVFGTPMQPNAIQTCSFLSTG